MKASVKTDSHYFPTALQEAARGKPPKNIKPQLQDDPAHRAAVEAFLRRQQRG